MAMRRRIYAEAAKPPTFAQIPDELLTQILAAVASSSHTDHFNAKICCKFFHNICEDDYVYRHMWMHNLFPYIAWDTRPEVKNFYNTCKSSGNPAVLYREGVAEYYTRKSKEAKSGLDLLREAANSGHKGAAYILGIILICNGEEHNGIKLLSSININIPSELRECFDQLFGILRWLRSYPLIRFPLQPHRFSCSIQHPPRRTNPWMTVWCPADDDTEPFCNTCIWNREIASVCYMW